jgi:ectoine hydroxylase-related dioxygenase (phytanoyl-CoA dioxygenase family)
MPQEKSYGVNKQAIVKDFRDFQREELQINGFCLLENLLSENELLKCRTKLDEIYKQQENEFGATELGNINEENIVRCPLKYDEFFLSLATNERILEVVRDVVGDYFILHLQNGIINKPNEEHHQSSWHRDLPYQNFVISKPLALGALYCIDDFTVESGGTFVLPFSHRVEIIPSLEYVAKYGMQIIAKAGTVILFDSMLFHKAGYNSSKFIRRAINHVFTVPILKQQINLFTALNGRYKDDAVLSKFLGYKSNSPSDDIAWRKSRQKK